MLCACAYARDKQQDKDMSSSYLRCFFFKISVADEGEGRSGEGVMKGDADRYGEADPISTDYLMIPTEDHDTSRSVVPKESAKICFAAVTCRCCCSAGSL